MNKLAVVLFLSALALYGCGLGASAYEDAILDGASSLNRGKLEKALGNFNRAIKIDPKAIRNAYLEEIRRHQDELGRQARLLSLDYIRLTTSTPLDIALSAYLAHRTARARSSA